MWRSICCVWLPKRKPGVSKCDCFSAGQVRLPLRSVYSKTVLYSALRSPLSSVFRVLCNFAPILMYRGKRNTLCHPYIESATALSDKAQFSSTIQEGSGTHAGCGFTCATFRCGPLHHSTISAVWRICSQLYIVHHSVQNVQRVIISQVVEN